MIILTGKKLVILIPEEVAAFIFPFNITIELIVW